jgi:SAM-dependent methyltransferase
MNLIPPINLCIIQPMGYVHGLGLLDPALYYEHQFRRLGAEVSLTKNRLKHNAVNFVFGAHNGVPKDWLDRHCCIVVNLEQVGRGGAQLPEAYHQLLRTTPVVDYDADNVASYAEPGEEVPIAPFGHAPYLAQDMLPLHERPIELLFIGSMNPRRQAIIQRIEATGTPVTLVDGPVYGPERDQLVRQAKAVLNCHFYESSRFEQVRTFQCLSLGTPVISELGPQTRPSPDFEPCVTWLPDAELSDFFRQVFRSDAWAERAVAQLQAFTEVDPLQAYADLLVFARKVYNQRMTALPLSRQPVTRLHIGSGKDYKPGWFNVDILPRSTPDALLDLTQPRNWPLDIDSPLQGPVRLQADTLECVYANNVLEHVHDLPALMTNCLNLLKVGGRFEIEVPYEKAPSAWQDPTHVRAFNARSWIYYADWFWYLGWLEHRFHVDTLGYLDAQLRPCNEDGAHFMRVSMQKVTTSLAERMTARTMQADFGGLATPVSYPQTLSA